MSMTETGLHLHRRRAGMTPLELRMAFMDAYTSAQWGTVIASGRFTEMLTAMNTDLEQARSLMAEMGVPLQGGARGGFQRRNDE